MTLVVFGRSQEWIVPADVYAVRAVLRGQGGGENTFPGGRPAEVTAIVPVTPGETLWIGLGDGYGFARGGTPRGGGASVLGRGTVNASNALIIAAGGGGGGADGIGGRGGGDVGSKSAGYGGGGEGGGVTSYASSTGESAVASDTGCGGGGGGLLGGRAGTKVTAGGQSPGVKQGAGGGGSSKYPLGATVTSDGARGAAVSLEHGLAPLGPPVSTPTPSSFVAIGRDLPVAWVFAGVGVGDTQSRAEVEHAAGAITNVLATSTAASLVIPGALVLAGAATIRVRTANQTGVYGPWSPAITVNGVTAPTDPVIASPADGSTITTATIPVQWAADDQTAYRVRYLSRDGAVVLDDSGIIEGSSPRTRTILAGSNGRRALVEVSVRGSSGAWSNPVTARVRTALTRPPTPSVIAVPEPDTGSMLITVTRPAPPVADTTLGAWRDALGRVVARTGTATLLAVGDSFTEGQGAPIRAQSWQRVLAGLLRADAALPAGGRDYFPVNFANFGVSAQTYTGAAGTAWTSWRDYSGGYDLGVNDARSLGKRSARSQPGATLTLTVVGTSLDVWWIQSSASSFTVRVDGILAATIPTTNAGGVAKQRVTLGTVAGASHEVLITYAGVVHVGGFEVRDGDEAFGVRVLDGAHNGYTSAQFAAMGAVHALAAPDLLAVCLGLNDPGAGIAPSATTTNLRAIIAQYRAATARATSVAVLVPQTYPGGDTTGPGGARWADYKAAMRAVAATDPTVRTIELPDLGASGPLYAADGAHPSVSGHALVASSLRAALAPVSAGSGAVTTTLRVHSRGGDQVISRPLPVTPAPTVYRWWLPASDVDYAISATDLSVDGVPAVGTAEHVSDGGWGVGPWGAAPWGS